jgi:hypothetical protein
MCIRGEARTRSKSFALREARAVVKQVKLSALPEFFMWHDVSFFVVRVFRVLASQSYRGKSVEREKCLVRRAPDNNLVLFVVRHADP